MREKNERKKTINRFFFFHDVLYLRFWIFSICLFIFFFAWEMTYEKVETVENPGKA